MSRSRYWCFTVNNYSQLLDASLWEGCRYCIYQEEIGAEGTPHLQGYLQLGLPLRLSTLKGFEGLETAHLEIARGSPKQAVDYCSKKDETYLDGPYEWGTLVSQGKRNDLVEVKAKLDAKVPMLQIAEDHFGSWCRYRKSFDAYLSMSIKHRTKKPLVVVAYGSGGLGKTYWATHSSLEGMTMEDVYFKDRSSGPWWDGYKGQRVILLDEFSGWMVPMELNRLCDEYHQEGQIKGGFVPLAPEVVVITTNFPPSSWWKPDVFLRAFPPFARRVDEWQYWYESRKYEACQEYHKFLEKAKLC